MTALFKNKYRNETTRLKNWNYGWKAMYFVTICTKDRECFFGHCQGGKMFLNNLGEIVVSEWLKTFAMRPDMNLFMGEYVVMPNHFHCILGIGENEFNTGQNLHRNLEYKSVCRDAMHCAPTNPTDTSQNQFGPQSKNLASIIRGFKTGVTVRARTINPYFVWQSRFHDHIIRDNKSFDRISHYIINNPSNWSDDTFRII